MKSPRRFSQLGKIISVFLLCFVFQIYFSDDNPVYCQVDAVQKTSFGLAGGDVKTIYPVPGEPGTVLVGTKEGKIFYSTSSGDQWIASTLPSMEPGIIIEIIISGFNDSEFFAGIRHEDGYGLIYQSFDSGKSWSLVETNENLPPIRTMAIVPAVKPLLLAGTTSGLWESADRGITWRKTFTPPSSSSVASLAVDPVSPNRVYLGTWRRAYRSEDGAQTFKTIWPNMSVDSHIFSFAIHPQKSNIVYASTCGWVYRSSHYGDSWSIKKSGLEDRRIHAMALSAQDPKTLFAATPSGLFVSSNEGKSWHRGSVNKLVINAVVADPASGAIYIGLEGQGVMRSVDNGANFHPVNNGLLSNSVQNLVTVGSTIYSSLSYGDQTSRIYFGPFHNPLENFLVIPGNIGKITSIQPLSQPDTSVLVGTYRGLFHVKQSIITAIEPQFIAGPIRKILSHPHRENVLFITTGKGLFASFDQGKTWTERSPDNYHGECFDLVIDQSDNNTLYLATLIGVFTSTDAGLHWEYSSFQLPKMKTSLLLQDPQLPETFFALTPKGLFRSQDSTKSWEAYISYELPRYISFLMFDPVMEHVLYANDLKNGGLFLSKNSGRTWKQIENLDSLRYIDACFGQSSQGNPTPKTTLFLGSFGSGMIRFNLDKAPPETNH